MVPEKDVAALAVAFDGLRVVVDPPQLVCVRAVFVITVRDDGGPPSDHHC